MQIIRRGYILPEENATYKHLAQLPDSWWCIGGTANRFTFQKNQGIQIDFIIICPTGLFLIESKNTHRIELSNGNQVKFYNTAGTQIRRSERHTNPIDEIIDIRYQMKDWLYKRQIETFLTANKKHLTVFIHGMLVLANEEQIQYQNCTLNKLNYSTHKYPTLMPLSRINAEFFEQTAIPTSCTRLSEEKMYCLFKILHNPDMDISQILSGMRQEHAQTYQEKEVYLTKIDILERENLSLQKSKDELESTRDNLLKIHQTQEEQLNEKEKALQKQIQEHKAQTRHLETELKKSAIQNPLKKNKATKHFFTAALILAAIAIFRGFQPKESDFAGKTVLAKISPHLHELEEAYQRSEHKRVLQIWKSITSKDLRIEDYTRYHKLIYAIARSYQAESAHKKAIAYFTLFTQLTKEPRFLIQGYFFKSHSVIVLQEAFRESIKELEAARALNTKHFQSDYNWEGPLVWNLATLYQTIHFKVSAEKKQALTQALKTRDFLAKSKEYYKKGKALAEANKDHFTAAKIHYELGHIATNSGQYTQALQHYIKAAQLLELLTPSIQSIEKLLLVNHEIALVLTEQQQHTQAEEYFKSILELCNDTQSILPKANRLNLAAQFYYSLGLLYEAKQAYKQAIQTYRTGQALARQYSRGTLIRQYKNKVSALQKDGVF